MSESIDDDSESGVEGPVSEEENSENESPRSPLSPPQTPSSPQSPPHSPPSGPQSPSSPPQSPLSGPQSPSSPPQSPLSGPRSPSSPINSPSSVAEQQSDDDVQVSGGEASDNESGNERDSVHEAEELEKDEDENLDKGKRQSDDDDSGPEENIPEINIESADEDDDQHSDRQNTSDNEMDQSRESEDEKEDKEDRESVNVQSDVEHKSDEELNDDDRPQLSNSSPLSSPQRPATSPIDDVEDQLSDNDKTISKVPSKEKEDSEAEENADSESEAESDESEVGGLIADIFGESDDDEEFEGFNEEDIGSEKVSKDGPAKKEKKKRTAKIMSDSEDEQEGIERAKEEAEEGEGIIEDLPAPPEEEEEEEDRVESTKKKQKVESDDSDDDGDRKMREDFVSDFDLMMQKKKEESSKRRKRKDVDLISDSDDLIADIISQMRVAAEEDKELNKQKKTATKKLKILSMVLSQLKKQDLKTAFLDQGVLNVIAEWLTPLPDRSLPHLNIREGMLKQLSDLPPFDQSLLKSSGIGRALMYLFKHPKETKENRERAGRLITEWARPIFNVTTNYHSLTKEEREQRDYDHVPKKRKLKDDSSQDEESQETRKDIEKELTGEQKSVRPGDKGWIARARVPMPSTKDYVNRPKWNVEMEFGRGPSKKPLSRIEKHMRLMQEKKRLSKGQRAITISIEGRKMAI